MARIHKSLLYDSIGNERLLAQPRNPSSYNHNYNDMCMHQTNHSSSYLQIDNGRSRAPPNAPIIDESSKPDTNSSFLYISMEQYASNPRRNHYAPSTNATNDRSLENTNTYTSDIQARRNASPSIQSNNNSSTTNTSSSQISNSNDRLRTQAMNSLQYALRQTSESHTFVGNERSIAQTKSASSTRIDNERSIAQTKSASSTRNGNERSIAQTKSVSCTRDDNERSIAQTKSASSTRIDNERSIAQTKSASSTRNGNERSIAQTKSVSCTRDDNERSIAHTKSASSTSIGNERSIAQTKSASYKRIGNEKSIAQTKSASSTRIGNERSIAQTKSASSTRIGNERSIAQTKSASSTSIGNERSIAKTKNASSTRIGNERSIAQTKSASSSSIGNERLIAQTKSASSTRIGNERSIAQTKSASSTRIGNERSIAQTNSSSSTRIVNERSIAQTKSASSTSIGNERSIEHSKRASSNHIGNERSIVTTTIASSNHIGNQRSIVPTKSASSTHIGNERSIVPTTIASSTRIGNDRSIVQTKNASSTRFGNERSIAQTKSSSSTSIGNERSIAQTQSASSTRIGNERSIAYTKSASSTSIGNERSIAHTKSASSTSIGNERSIAQTKSESSTRIGNERSIAQTKSASSTLIGNEISIEHSKRASSYHIGNEKSIAPTTIASSTRIGNDRSIAHTKSASSYTLTGNAMPLTTTNNSLSFPVSTYDSFVTSTTQSSSSTQIRNSRLIAKTNKSSSNDNIDCDRLMSRSSSYIDIGADRTRSNGQRVNLSQYTSKVSSMSMSQLNGSRPYTNLSNDKELTPTNKASSHDQNRPDTSIKQTHDSFSYTLIDSDRSKAHANKSSSYAIICNDGSSERTNNSLSYCSIGSGSSMARRQGSSSYIHIGNERSMTQSNNNSPYTQSINDMQFSQANNSSSNTVFANGSFVAPTKKSSSFTQIGDGRLISQTNNSSVYPTIGSDSSMTRSSSYITIGSRRSLAQTSNSSSKNHSGIDRTTKRVSNWFSSESIGDARTRVGTNHSSSDINMGDDSSKRSANNSSKDVHTFTTSTNGSCSSHINRKIGRPTMRVGRSNSEPCVVLNIDEEKHPFSFVKPTIIRDGNKRYRYGEDAQSLRSEYRYYRSSENGDASRPSLLDSSSQINVVVKNPRNCNFSGHNGENSIALSPKTKTDLEDKVEAQTLLVLREVQNKETGAIFGFKTTLYNLAKEKLQQPTSIQILIIKGNGLGCDFVAKMLFAEACLENQTTGFYLRDVHEWIVANKHIGGEKRGAVLILNANITDWLNIIKHEMLPSAKKGDYLTVIMTTQNCDEVESLLGNFIVNASAPDALPSEEDKVQVFDMMCRRKCLQIEENCIDIASAATKTSRYPTITTQTKYRILKDIGTYNWIRRLNTFFSGTIEEGSSFFRKPDSHIVNYLRTQIPSKKDHQSTSLFCLLLIYVFGNLHVNTIIWIRENKRIPAAKIMKRLQNDNANDQNRKVFPRFKRIIKYCNGLHRLQHLLDNIYNELEILRDAMYIKLENRAYQFDGEHVRASFMVALSEVIPEEIVESCDEEFLFDCIGGRENVEFPILGNDKKVTKIFFKRMRHHWHEDMVKCIKHPSLALHFEKFLQYLECTKHALWPVLTHLDDTDRHCALFYGMETEVPCNVSMKFPTEVILQNSKWKKKRKQKKWKEFTMVQETFALIHAAELGNTTVFEALVDYGVQMTKEAIVAAIKAQAVDIILKSFMSKEISDNEWIDCVFESVKLYSSSKSEQDRHILDLFMRTHWGKLNISAAKTVPLLHRVVNDQRMLEVLLEGEWGKLIDIDVVYYYNQHAKTALDLAIESGNNYTSHYLLSYGAVPVAKRKRRQL